MKAEENPGAASGGAALVSAYIGVGFLNCQHLVTKNREFFATFSALSDRQGKGSLFFFLALFMTKRKTTEE